MQTKDLQILGMIKMTKLIDKDDPQWFAQTSDIPYDRHHYKLSLSQNKSFVVESWDESRMVVE